MKKRGTALLLALILGICMAGCGAQSEETDDSSQTAQTQDDTDTGNSQEEEQGSAGGQGNVLNAFVNLLVNVLHLKRKGNAACHLETMAVYRSPRIYWLSTTCNQSKRNIK